MKAKSLLVLQADGIPPDGLTLIGAVSLAELEIPESDRLVGTSPVEIHLAVSVVRSGILVQGTLKNTVRCRCDRCLAFYDFGVELPEVCHFYKIAESKEIDLTVDLREDILLIFPQRQLCRAECRGLCTRCGQNLNVRECGCQDAVEANGTWSALEGFRAAGGDDADGPA